jgi:hypothetical protein
MARLLKPPRHFAVTNLHYQTRHSPGTFARQCYSSLLACITISFLDLRILASLPSLAFALIRLRLFDNEFGSFGRAFGWKLDTFDSLDRPSF